MKSWRTLVLVLLLTSLTPNIAFGWWEATLQQIDIALVLSHEGRVRVAYDLRYHVDRGRFEGTNLNNPGRSVQWDRMSSFIEDARGRRYPVRISRRGRDGAYLVRLANASGLRRGWVTVHLEYEAEVMDCCLRLDEDGRPFFRWSAISWDVGMDRMTLTMRLAPETGELTPDESTRREFTIEETERGLVIERIRPVRWYEMNIGLYLPEDFLVRRPDREVLASSRPMPENEDTATIVPLAHDGDQLALSRLANRWYVLVVFACILLLALKAWVTSLGYAGRSSAAPPLLLPLVPPVIRWAFLGGTMLIGGWLQSSGFLAAGTLAFAAGVVLSLRGPNQQDRTDAPARWSPAEDDGATLTEAFRSRGRRRWATLFDGTTLAGVPLFVALTAGAVAGMMRLQEHLGLAAIEGLIIDVTLTLVAFGFTARQRDITPDLRESTTKSLIRLRTKLTKLTEASGASPRIELGFNEEGDRIDALRIAFSPAPQDLDGLFIQPHPHLGTFGWSQRLVATLIDGNGRRRQLDARTASHLARKIRRTLKTMTSDRK